MQPHAHILSSLPGKHDDDEEEQFKSNSSILISNPTRRNILIASSSQSKANCVHNEAAPEIHLRTNPMFIQTFETGVSDRPGCSIFSNVVREWHGFCYYMLCRKVSWKTLSLTMSWHGSGKLRNRFKASFQLNVKQIEGFIIFQVSLTLRLDCLDGNWIRS